MTDSQTPDQGKTARATCLFALVLIAIALLVYRPAWNGRPIWDDDAHITNPSLRSLYGLTLIWTQLGVTQQYYPLIHTAFWIEQKLWDDSFLGYHLINILLHSAGAIALLQILLRLKIPGAWLAAGLFALHPVQVESVAWISELKNTLSGAFFFCSLLVYLKFDERRTNLAYVGSVVLFIFGLLCKTAIAPLPAIIAVILWWKRGQVRFRRDLLPLIPFFVLGLLAGCFTTLFERIFTGAAGSEFQLSILQRCLIAGRDFWFYLFKLIWPAKLTFIYPRWNVSGAVWWEYLFPIGALLLLACAWHLRNRNRGPLAVALIFLGLLFPALGFIDVFPFLYSFVADHFQYLACAAPLTLFAAGVAVAVEKITPTAKNFLGPVVSLALLSTLGFLSWQQAHDYHDVETLWRTTIVRNPSCWMAYSNLGSFLSGMGLTDEAIQNFRKALELRPDQSKDRNNLGKALLQQGRFMEAMEEFQAALKILPNDPVAENNIGAAYLEKGDVDNAIDYLGKAVHDGPRNADAYINFGNALLKKQDFDAAIAAYSRTLDLPFDQAESHYSIANALRQKGENGEAILSYKFAIQLRPDYVDAHNNLANALRQQGRIEEAIQEYEAALKYRPQFHLAQNNLAWILATAADSRLRNGSKAVELAEKAVIATNGNDPIFLHTLAAAYAENGEFEKAVAAAQDALAIADASGLTSLAESLNSMIALFKSGSAYRESASTPQESSH